MTVDRRTYRGGTSGKLVGILVVRVPEVLMQRIDTVVKKNHITRSEVVRDALARVFGLKMRTP